MRRHIRNRLGHPARSCWLGFCCWLLLVGIASAQPRAWFDREQASLGESVTLNIESEGEAGEPDFSVLEKDFRITGRSSSSQVQIINGVVRSSRLWAVMLEPLREGLIELPGIPVGQLRSGPLRLNVQPAAQGSAANGDEVFLEVEAQPRNPYVQQQVQYVVRLFYAVQLLDGSLNEPQGEHLQVRRIGQDVTYTRDIGGRRYSVIERRYAVTPERSGRLQVEGLVFQGRTVRGHSMFNPGVMLAAGSQAVTLDVRSAPAQAAQPWLPATALRLHDDADRLPAQVRAGDALELTLTAEASGLSEEQLPELSLPPIDGAEVYPGQETRQTREADGQLIGVRSRRFAIVPLRPGRLELPERRMAWWDVQSDQHTQTALPARSIEVLPAVAAAPSASPAETSASDELAEVGSVAQDAGAAGSLRLWQGLSGVLALGWLLSALWAWPRLRRAASSAATVARPTAGQRTRPWQAQLTQALAREDVAQVRQALLQIDPAIRDLGALALRLADPVQREAVLALERRLYRGDAGAAPIEQLRHAFARAPVLIPPQAASAPAGDGLPPLYRA